MCHTNTFWAGCMIRLKSGPYAGKYMINYCVCQGGCPQGGIGYAISDVPQGPYKDMGMLLYSFGSGRTQDIYDAETLSQLRRGERGNAEVMAEVTAPDGTALKYNSNIHPNAIDPCTFYDTDGQLWMLYGSFSGGIFIHKLNDDGTIMREEGDSYYGKLLMGNFEFQPYGDEVNPSEAYMSPGHYSVLYDADRDQYFHFFHTRFKGHGNSFQVRVHELFMNEDGWPVVAPHRYSGDLDVRLARRDVVGEYKFVNHGTKISSDITESTLVSLNADGTISGSVTGTWSADKGDKKLNATFNVEGKEYKGVFHYQYDPAANVNRVTFTACGNSNETIWGSKAVVVK